MKSLSPFETDPKAIDARLAMKKPALDRVLNAPGLPLLVEVEMPDGTVATKNATEGARELFRLTLASLADWSVSAVLGSRIATVEEIDSVDEALQRLMRKLSALQFTDSSPPPIPKDWLRQIDIWRASLEVKRTRGRKPNSSEDLIYAYLLGFFRMAFGREPGSGDSGPAIAFVTSFFAEMSATFSSAHWEGPSPDGTVRPALATLFAIPSADALRGRLRKAKASQHYVAAAKQMIALAEAVQEHPREGTVEVLN